MLLEMAVPLVMVTTGPKATLAMTKGGETTAFKLEDEFAGVSKSQTSEDFDVEGRGKFYDQTGALRDVVQNHLLQVLTNIAMEPPPGLDAEMLRDEKAKVLKGIRPLAPRSRGRP